MPARYVSASTVATWFGVAPSTIHTWRARYAGTPEPDAFIDKTVGWLPDRREEWTAWYHAHGPGLRWRSASSRPPP